MCVIQDHRKASMSDDQKSKDNDNLVIGIVSLLLIVTCISLFIANRSDNSQAQSKCLDDAHKTYKAQWDQKADKEGSVSYSDGWLDINTAYYDAEVNCYRTDSTSDSDACVSDIQAQRKQDTDKYNTWVNSINGASHIHCTTINLSLIHI